MLTVNNLYEMFTEVKGAQILQNDIMYIGSLSFEESVLVRGHHLVIPVRD